MADTLALHRIEIADGNLRRGCGDDGSDEAGQSDKDGGCLHVGCWLQDGVGSGLVRSGRTEEGLQGTRRTTTTNGEGQLRK
jgi:hypothetical protein